MLSRSRRSVSLGKSSFGDQEPIWPDAEEVRRRRDPSGHLDWHLVEWFFRWNWRRRCRDSFHRCSTWNPCRDPRFRRTSLRSKLGEKPEPPGTGANKLRTEVLYRIMQFGVGPLTAPSKSLRKLRKGPGAGQFKRACEPKQAAVDENQYVVDAVSRK